MFGSTSATITRDRFSPSASAATTKSRETMPRATPRETRATRGAWEMPIISTMIHGAGSSRAVSTTSESRICGKASTTSLSRMMISSHQPPAYAATTPTRTPTTMPRMVASTAITRMPVPPCISRLSTS